MQTNALIGRGDVLHALGRGREALESYNRAIETGPNFGTAWHGKGEAQKALGQEHNASMSVYVAQELGTRMKPIDLSKIMNFSLPSDE